MKIGGWLRDLPDLRDYSFDHPKVASLVGSTLGLDFPSRVDWREFCSPVADQGFYQSCTANAVASMLEFNQRVAFGQYTDASRMFIYKTSRRLSGLQGDSGSYIRATIQSVRRFGAPEEVFWPYDGVHMDTEPDAFTYSLANDFRALTYMRVDAHGFDQNSVLIIIKQLIAQKHPIVLGFCAYNAITLPNTQRTGRIQFPVAGVDMLIGGHAVMACGYDDDMRINRQDGIVDTGALLIQNSWGEGWGEKGFGWLPYAYLLYPLAWDCWTIYHQDWIDTGNFA